MKDRGVTHELKTRAEYWDAIAAGDKTFEVRRDDRGFQRGDKVLLVKMRTDNPIYEHRDAFSNARKTIERTITYVLTGGQLGVEPGYVVLGLSRR